MLNFLLTFSGGCENKFFDDAMCEKWKREGKCTDARYRRYLAKVCSKTCNYCNGGQSILNIII